jgi:hypothetical protein
VAQEGLVGVIDTYDKSGGLNGYVIPLWHVDQGPKIEQVYLTTLLPYAMKGPHLHRKRRGLFFCIKGRILLVTRVLEFGYYATHELRPGSPPVEVPPGIPAALYNVADNVESLVLNMPSPPWRVGEEDEHEVTDWTWRP